MQGRYLSPQRPPAQRVATANTGCPGNAGRLACYNVIRVDYASCIGRAEDCIGLAAEPSAADESLEPSKHDRDNYETSTGTVF